jgi:hypothetical protein
MTFPKLKIHERELVDAIVARFYEICFQHNYALNLLSFMMDVHAVARKIDLEKLATFQDFSFLHDCFGIMTNLNRITGKFNNCFLPRCAKKKGARSANNKAG